MTKAFLLLYSLALPILCFAGSPAATGSLFEFCTKEAFVGASLLMGSTMAEACDTSQNPPIMSYHSNPLFLSNLPTEINSEAAYQNFDSGALGLGRDPLTTAMEIFGNPEVSAGEHSSIRDAFQRVRAIEPFVSPMTTLHGMTVCAELTILGSEACADGIKRIFEYMSPRSSGGAGDPRVIDIALLDPFETVLTDPSYVKGLSRASKKIMKRISDGGAPGGSLYTDLLGAFREEGLSPEDAEDHTWNTLGVIATAGSNMWHRIQRLGIVGLNRPVTTALALIGPAQAVLDFRGARAGRMYSFPPDVVSTCDSGKPYHFWMAAYLARRLVKEGLAPTAASAAAFSSLKGYEFKSETGFRTNWRAYTVETLDPFNNVMRMDLAYGAAGAKWGAAMGESRELTISVDESVRKLIARAGTIDLLTREEAQELVSSSPISAYWKWSKIFSPNSAY